MKIVKFSDGRYAIRKFRLIEIFFGCVYVYLDLNSDSHFKYWWNIDDAFFDNCKGTLKQCKKELEHQKDSGVVVRLK